MPQGCCRQETKDDVTSTAYNYSLEIKFINPSCFKISKREVVWGIWGGCVVVVVVISVQKLKCRSGTRHRLDVTPLFVVGFSTGSP